MTHEDTDLTIALSDVVILNADDSKSYTVQVVDGSGYTASGATVTPGADFNGLLTVGVTVNDGAETSNAFPALLTVTAVNDAPVIHGQGALVLEQGQALTVRLTDLTVTDVDNLGYPIGFSLTVQDGDRYSVNGAVVTPDADFAGPLSVPVQVSDIAGGTSDPFNLTIAVNAVDTPPTAGDDVIQTPEDTPVAIDVLSNDSDAETSVDGSSIALTATTIDGKGTFAVSGNMVTFTPVADFYGDATTQYTVKDTDGEVSNTATIKVTVTPVNDKPEITGQNTVATNEDTPITLDLSQLIVKDVDNSYPTGFSLVVSPGMNYSASGSTVTPNPDFTGTLSVPVQVNDGADLSNTFNLQITVNPVNDPPQITGQISLSVNEGNTITLVPANLTIKDPDNTSGFILTVLAGTGYSFSGNTVTPDRNGPPTITVNVKVNDGASDSPVYGVQVTVNAVNDAPVINGQVGALTTAEEQPLTLTLQNFTVTDPDNTYPSDFSLSVQAGANYTVAGTTITPNTNYSGPLTVPVRVNDGTTNSAVFNASVTVTPVNDAPEIKGQQVLSVAEDNSITLRLNQLTVTDVDNPGYPAGFTLTAQPGNNYTLSGNIVTPAKDYNGVLSVPVTVSDGTSSSNVFNVQITVTPINDVPQITGQNPLSMGQRESITLNLSNLFVQDPDNNYPADFTLFVLSGSNYSVSNTTVTPNPNFSGQLLVKVQVSDGLANSPTYDLQILVNSVNAAPTITGQDALNTNEDTPFTIVPGNLKVNDPDNTYPTGFTITILPGSNYTASGLTVTPANNFNGTLSVNVKVNDGLSDSAPYGLQIAVNPVNDPPTVTGQLALSTKEDTPLTIPLSSLVVSDPDDTYPTGFSVSVQPGNNYTVSGNTITPAQNYNGSLTVPVQVSDGKTNSATFNLLVTVEAVNDAPSIKGQVVLTTPEDTPITVKLTDLMVEDPDNNYPAGFSLAIQAGANYTFSGRTVTPALNYNGTLSVNVTVNDGAASSAAFPLQINVSSVNTAPSITGQKALATNEETALTINLTDLVVNDPDDSYPNGFTLTVGSGNNYTLSGNTITPALNYTGNLTVPVVVNDGVNNSNSYSLTVKVNPVDDAPEIKGQQAITINEDQPITLQLTHLQVTDIDTPGYPSGFTLSVLPGTNYTVSGTTVTPAQDFNGTLSVNVTVSDGLVSSAVFVVTIKVNAVNDAPTSSGFTASVVDEDYANEVVINLLNVFHDAEDPVTALTYTLTNDHPAYFQTVAINQAAGELRYRLKANAFGTAKVTVKATDTGGKFVSDVLTITINPINDPPSFDVIPDQQVIENSGQKTINITNISKGPLETSQTLNFFVTSGNTDVIPNPTITYDGTSTTAQLKYQPQPNKFGNVTINIFAIDDGSNADPNRNSFTTSFQINVVQVNNAPTLGTISFGPILEDAPEQSIPLTGISAGAGETQVLTVAAAYNKPDMLEDPVIDYTSPNATGTLKIKPKPNANGTVQITVTVTDDGAGSPAPNVNTVSRQFNLVIQPVNDLPVFSSQPVTLAAVGELYTYEVAAMDVDNPNFTLTVLQKPDWLTFTLKAVDPAAPNVKTATLSGTPGASVSGNFVVQLQAKDADAPVVQQFTLNVNSRPSVTSFEVSTKEDTSLPLEVSKFTSAFSDPDGNSLASIRIKALPNPRLGLLKLNNTPVALDQEIPFESLGGLSYVPLPDQTGVDTVRFIASDGLVYSDDSRALWGRIRITVTPVNDAPIITLESQDDFLPYLIGTGPQALTRAFRAEDPDQDSLVNAEVGFRAQHYVVSLDELSFTDTEHIKGTFNIQSGTLTMTGKAPASEYTSFIQGIKYNFKSPRLPEDTVKIAYITVSDGKLLSDTKDRFVHLRYTFTELDIVGGFTPNGDHANETWVPISRSRNAEFKDSELKIYDRRGRLLFETIGFEKEWDGVFNGELLPAESYYFTLDLKLPFLKKTYKGVVTILR